MKWNRSFNRDTAENSKILKKYRTVSADILAGKKTYPTEDSYVELYVDSSEDKGKDISSAQDSKVEPAQQGKQKDSKTN